MRLGLVTYNLAKDWDLDTLLANCEETGFEGVELRTTHAHGVETSLDALGRAEVKARFADSPVVCWGLGTTCEFDSPDPAVVAGQIDEAKRFIELAHDIGCQGVKVRPNHLHEGIPPEQTADQIGRSLATIGDVAQAAGVTIYLEVHGRGTSDPKLVRRMLDTCGHPSVGACWNSNPTPQEVIDGSIAETFALLADDIVSCHITELWRPDYPYRQLFSQLAAIDYQGFCLAEIPGSDDPVRLMRYYRALFEALQPGA